MIKISPFLQKLGEHDAHIIITLTSWVPVVTNGKLGICLSSTFHVLVKYSKNTRHVIFLDVLWSVHYIKRYHYYNLLAVIFVKLAMALKPAFTLVKIGIAKYNAKF